MKECWRWYGPLDTISLQEVAQTGATGIVTALHEVPYSEVWTREAVAARKQMIDSSGLGLNWEVVESLPVHERIKRADGDLSQLLANYRQSMANLAAEGIRTICYNFMPLLDWTRTDLADPLPRGGNALKFSAPRMAAFEIFMLESDGAEDRYTAEAVAAGKAWFDASDEDDRDALLHAIMAGLPGAYDRYDVPELREALAAYAEIDRDTLRANYKAFLEAVIPVAEELGMRLCVHPDDPPRDILGLPRIVTNADDIGWIMDAVPSAANGLTLCAGSLGANPDNDVPAIAERFADRIHFAHLRNVAKEPDGSFVEAAHLDGDTDMAALMRVLLAEEKRRRDVGLCAWEIPMRPDHGHVLLDDHSRNAHPGYPLIGRMRGLAELRGLMAGVASAE
ncbi:MAG: mannonate dehydratase [Pseudomonadota bacterium]